MDRRRRRPDRNQGAADPPRRVAGGGHRHRRRDQQGVQLGDRVRLERPRGRHLARKRKLRKTAIGARTLDRAERLDDETGHRESGRRTTSEPCELDVAATSDDGAIIAWHNGKSKPLFRIVEAAYLTAGGAAQRTDSAHLRRRVDPCTGRSQQYRRIGDGLARQLGRAPGLLADRGAGIAENSGARSDRRPGARDRWAATISNSPTRWAPTPARSSTTRCPPTAASAQRRPSNRRPRTDLRHSHCHQPGQPIGGGLGPCRRQGANGQDPFYRARRQP